MDKIKPNEVSDILLQQLKEVNIDVQLEEVGVVLTVGDGVVRIYGLNNVTENELIEFENGVMAVAMNLEEDNVGGVDKIVAKEIRKNLTVEILTS